VQCLEAVDCTGTKKLCDETSDSCVECLATTDCKEAKSAKCDGKSCTKCTSNDDCAHISGKTVCDAVAGECVQCTAADEAACDGKSCNPATKTCTGTVVGSLSTCTPCLADSECSGGGEADPDYRCIPMQFQGQARAGGYCLRRAVKTCGRPYTIAISAKRLSGAGSENYCGIDQDNVSCEAAIDLEDSRVCESGADSACGCARDENGVCVGDGRGGLCRDFAVLQKQCTYLCGVTNDCPSGKQCLGAPTRFCQ
jgi:hypothetical protein